MSKKSLFLIFIFFAGAVLSVSVLYVLSKTSNAQRNGFSRQFNYSIVGSKNKLDIRYNSYYIAGLSTDKIYLGNYTSAVHLLVADHSLIDTQHIKIDVPKNLSIAWKSLRTAVNPPYIFMTEGLSPTYLIGRIGNFKVVNRNLDSQKFNGIVQLSPSTAVLRAYNRQLSQNILTQVTTDTLKPRRKDFIPDKQLDGIFSLDGMFLHNPNTSILVYLYYYSNQFLCLDEDLNLLYEGRTIDTISTAQIKIARIASEQKTTMGAPPLRVNIKGAISENWIFVNSGLMADNEDKRAFRNNSVIDVYSLYERHYKFSFYLPKYKGEKLAHFKVSGNKLAALYDRYLVIYNLNAKYFEEE